MSQNPNIILIGAGPVGTVAAESAASAAARARFPESWVSSLARSARPKGPSRLSKVA